MLIKNKNIIKRYKLRFIIAGIVVVTLILGGGVLYYIRQQASGPHPATSDHKIDYSPAKPSDKIQDSAKDDLSKPIQDGQDSNEAAPSSLAVTISSASQQDQAISVRALIDGTTSGTCTLTATLSGQPPIVRTAAISAQASYAICQGFNFTTADFPTSGNWTIEIQAEYNGNKTTAKTNVEITK